MRNSKSKKVVQNTRGKSSGEKLEKKNSFFIQKHCLCSTITLNLRGFCRGGICRGICRESRTYILDQPVNTCHAQIHSKSVYLLDILSCDLTELVVKKHRIVKYKISHCRRDRGPRFARVHSEFITEVLFLNFSKDIASL